VKAPILAPAAVLVLWTLLVLVWMAIVRARAVRDLPAGRLEQMPRAGLRGHDLERMLPDSAAWPSHNYSHLLEQPTLFYATVALLALAGEGGAVNTALAWGYTGLRIAHSVWQIAVNTIPVRFALFLASTACLIALAVNLVRATTA
jgi:hypothetical protein